MRLPSFCALRALCLLPLVAGLLSPAARADLVWTAQTGWRVEGGVLAGVDGPAGRKALDLMNSARASEDQGSVRSALRSYAKVAKTYPNSIYAPEALYRSARLELNRKNYIKAFEDFQQVVGRYPNSKRFNEIIGEQYRIASSLLDGARGRMMWNLLPGFKNRERGVEYFETILVNAPYSDYAPLSLMNIARGHHSLKQTENAVDALDRMINNYPQSLLAPDAYLKIAQTHATLVEGPYYDQAATKESITYFTDFMLLYPSDANIGAAEKGLDGMKSMLAESKMKMADFYFYKRNNFTAARIFYNEAITSYPDSAVARRAKLRLADVEAKVAGKPVPTQGKAEGDAAPKKKRFWIF
ncbi:MAG: outer membrane protein assembly factor BamD [Opitutus sp.]|nr:outer membrane protein assembly factor BamD [Opitutus sp.]